MAVALVVGVFVLRAVPGAVLPAQPSAQPVAGTPLPTSQDPAARAPVAALTNAIGAPSRPVSRLDFDSADDLYGLATAAANSNNVMTLHNGRHAALSCVMAPTRIELETLIAGGRGDLVDEERKRAAALVLRRCAGFFNNDKAANDALRRRFRSSLQAHDGEYSVGMTQGGPTDKQIALAIQRGDWVTFSSAFSNI